MTSADGRRDEAEANGEDASADRRTRLAVERTQLAWWRTGLTSLAVAIGIGRVVPELSDSQTTWPYGAVGIAFAVYGIALFARGTSRVRPRASGIDVALAAAGPLLGLVIIALVAAP